MIAHDFNWLNIRKINGNEREGFEEFICQIARNETDFTSEKFYRLGNPDGGIECYRELKDGTIIGWQAKYFITSLKNDQWKQIKKSFISSIKNYNNLVKWILTIPHDPSHTMDTKSKEKIRELKEIAKKEGMEIEIEIWWSSDLINIISKPKYEGFMKFWFDNLEFTNKWFQDKVEKSLKNITDYNPDLNIKKDNTELFDSASRNSKSIMSFNIKLNSYVNYLKKSINPIENDELNKILYELNKICRNLKLTEMNEINFNEIDYLLNNLKDIIDNSQIEPENLKTKIFHHINNFKRFLRSTETQLLNKPFLLIYGEAGIGKSFLFADISNEKIKNNENIILLCGHQFQYKENPENIILKELGIPSTISFEEFLDALECKAQIQNSRILILIDAINEGKGLELWNNYFNGFVNMISKRKWIGCIFSIRNTYLDNFNNNSDLISSVQIHGFEDKSYEAVQKYFDYYNITLDPTYLFRYEFAYSPLYLKIYCKTLKNNNYSIPKGLDRFTKVIDLYITSINKKIGCPDSSNFAEKILLELVKNNLTNNLTTEKSVTIIKKLLDINLIKASQILEKLIQEGILIKRIINNEELIFITFQKLEDYLITKSLLNNVSKDELKQKFNNNGELIKSIYNNNYFDIELIEMLSMYIPEQYNVELYEILDEHLKDNYYIANGFINSLKWRISSINEKSKSYIEQIKIHPNTYKNFLETLILIAPIQNHIFNAEYLHNLLINKELSVRDEEWTIFINSKQPTINKILKFAISKNNHLFTEETIKLLSILISWFLTSSNRQVRDLSTRTLIQLLKDKINILIEILKLFKKVNDPYVYERLYCVAYGCSLLTSNKNSLINLSNYIYEEIFNQNEVYPNILLRDYARNTIEFALKNNLSLDIDLKKIRPPYNSIFPKIPTDDEVNEYYSNHRSVCRIFQSMEVEHNREGKSIFYGNFGRYVFQSAFNLWKNKLKLDNINFIDLKNISIKRIFELGYDEDKHGAYDKFIINNPYSGISERIGKKYQRIAFLELLSQVSDKYEIMDYDYVTNDENINYVGPWQEFIRDIDPTIIKNNILNYKISTFDTIYNDSLFTDKQWIKNSKDLPDPKELLEIKLPKNEEDYLLLSGHLEWKEKLEFNYENDPQKLLWYEFNSYIIKNEDFNKIKSYLKHANIHELNIDNYITYREIFNKEIYQSIPFDYFYKNEWDEKNIISINNQEYPLEETTLRTNSIERDTLENKSFLRINKKIFDELKLSYGNYDSFIYSNNSIIGFDVLELGYPSAFLFNKKYMETYLNKHDKKLFFTIFGRKMNLRNIKHNSILEFEGIYYLENNEIKKLVFNPFYKLNYENLSTYLNGTIQKLDIYDEDNSEYYFDNENIILYKFSKITNLNELTLNKKLLKEEKGMYKIYHVSNLKIKEEFDKLNNEGYIIIIPQNKEFYIITIIGSKELKISNLNTKLYQKYIKYLITNLDIRNHESSKLNITIKQLLNNLN